MPLKSPKAFLRALVLLALVCAGPIYGQQIYYKHYSPIDGLPSSLLYRVFIDSKGFVWVSSDAGISRFDGTSFRNYTSDDGMPDNEVFDISEDKSGRIWFTTLKGAEGHVFENRVYSSNRFPANDTEKIQCIYNDPKGFRWSSSYTGSIRKNYGDSTVQAYRFSGARIISFFEDTYGTLWFSTFYSDKLHYIGQDGRIGEVKLLPHTSSYIYSCRVSGLRDGRLAFHGLKHWGILDPLKKKVDFLMVSDSLGTGINMCMLEDESKNMWIGTTDGIVVYEPTEDGFRKKRNILPGKNITSISRDFEGNFWVATLGSGLFFIPSNPLNVSNYTETGSSNNISCIVRDNGGKIWAGSEEGKIYRISGDHIEPVFHDFAYNTVSRITCVLYHSNGNIWFGKDNGFTLLRDGVISKVPKYNSPVKCITEGANGDIWVGDYAYLSRYDSGMNFISRYRVGRVTAMHYDADGILWFSTDRGLHQLKDGLVRMMSGTSLLTNQRISEFLPDDKTGIIWLATIGNGVIGLKNGKLVHHLTINNGLSSNICSSITAGKDGTLWISTKSGINHVKVLGSGNYNVQLINHENGMLSDEINQILFTGDTIWAATYHGVSAFRPSATNLSTFAPPVYIHSVSINGDEFPLQDNYILSNVQNNLKIDVVGISYVSSTGMKYMYKMEGIDSNWVVSRSSIINYSALSPGSYRFFVKAINSRGIQSISAASFSLEIRQAYWQTNWFKAFVGFIIFLIILSSIVVRIKVIKKREEEKTRLNKMLGELELTALKAQMNPHFIFNSLGSIQNLINRDKKTEANLYLSKFAKLLRMTLDHSDKKEVSLADEINMLELYLGLESLRFTNKFEYHFDVDKSIDVYSVRVPPMILQPFIENAIKHGLLPKKADAFLTIRFAVIEDQTLYCMVEDNGIGRLQREKLKEKTSTGHVSKGIKITRNRLELVNQLRNRPAEIKITDLYNTAGNAAGTRIEIFIPFE